MAVLLSHKNIDSEAESNSECFEDKGDGYKFSLGNVKSYFKNLMKNNSYHLENAARKITPLPEIVKEIFTLKNDNEEIDERQISLDVSGEEREILLEEQSSNSSVSLNSFTNLQLRFLNESLEEAEASFDKMVEKKNLERLEEYSLTVSSDDDSFKDSFGELRIHQIDLSEFEDEIDLSEEDNSSLDSDTDIVTNHLYEETEDS
eukprot:GFUD01032883.1.p1 GENE.GFUD01032883.1~~GFUD01032883.1.p1  ORF type:complete len:204 (+),score=64.77 GFUD01032883.1:51-662(+)